MTERAYRERMVYEAVQALGRLYVWGGNGPSWFDCSGYVLHCLRWSGTRPNHPDMTADDMLHGWPEISLTQAQPGDVCLYGQGDTATHVTLALTPHARIVAGANNGRSFRALGYSADRMDQLSPDQQVAYLEAMKNRGACVRVELDGHLYRDDFLGFRRAPVPQG